MSDMIRNRKLTLRSCAVRGPKGDTGAAGADGKDGTNGKDGKDANVLAFTVAPNELGTGYECSMSLSKILQELQLNPAAVLVFMPLGGDTEYFANVGYTETALIADVFIPSSTGSAANTRWYHIYMASVGGSDTITVSEYEGRFVPAPSLSDVGKVLTVSNTGKPVWADLPS